MSEIEISIVIPTFNRQRNLAKVLAGLENQTCSPRTFEVVVVSDGSTDGTDGFLEEVGTAFTLRPVFQSNQGVAAARNTGVDHAGAERILFLDDDVFPSPELVSEHLDWLKRHERAVVLGPMLTPPDARLLPWVLWEQAMLEKQYQSMENGEWKPTARQFFTGNTSLEKRYIRQAGGFDTTFRRAEDVDLAYRLKDLDLCFLFNPKAVGYHYAERSFESWVDIAYTYGENDVIMTREKKQAWLLPQILREYKSRNILVRGLTRLCLDRKRLQVECVASLKSLALAADRRKQRRLSRYLLSGIYNLRYYQGMADRLGGREVFFSYLQGARSPDRKVLARGTSER